MKVEVGRAAVWQHAEEADLQGMIRKVAAHFEIADIAIFTPGKLTYVNEPPRRYHRIRPFESDHRFDTATGKLVRKGNGK